MGDCKPTIAEMETEEELIAAAKQIMKALETNKNLTDDAKKILSNLCMQLCDITRENEQKDEGVKENEGLNEIEQQLDLIQDKVLSWERDQSIIWDCGPEEAYEYLKAVDEARKLTERLERLSLNNGSEDTTLLHRAHDVLQMAMARLEEEFKHLLVQNRQPFELEHMSFRSSEDDIMEAGSVISSGDDSLEDVVQRDSMSRGPEEYIIELVHPDVIPDLRSIANLMFDSNYGRECTQAFISVQKDALDDCIYILEVDKLSIEDVLRMEWNTLNSKIRRWIRAMKIFVRVYLSSEKLLSDKIFGDLESVSSVCFVESSKTVILQLLNFGEAIAIGPHQPEKLIRILDMYEVLADLIPYIDTLYSDDTGSCVRIEWQDILRRLGDCAKATFLEFENAVASNVSTNPFPGGGVHHLTRYVMNYIKTLADYRETLDVILKDHEREDPISFSLDMSPVSEEENIEGSSSVSPMARHFQSLIAILECNLHDKSKLYKDDSLQQARKLTERLERLSLNNGSEDTTLLHRDHDVHQMAMARFEEEFKHLLVQNRQPFELEHMPFRSSEDDIMEAGSVISSGDDSLEDVVQRDSMSRGPEEYIIELVHPDVIPDLRSIANLMFDSNYGRECTQAFISVQKDALDDCIYILEVDKLSIEDVLRMEWNTLNSKIRRWIRAMKIFVRVYLSSEKLLSDKIFGDLESVSSVCFVESSKTAILQLLNFGEAIAIGPHQPEKLIRILDMYEVLADLIPYIDTLYSDDTGSCVRIEWQDILRRLGDCAKATFLEFENAVASNVSTNPFPGGGVHHLTRYVMNYIKTLADYRETLDVILKDHEREDPISFSPDMSPVSEEENIEGSSSVSPMARHFQSLIAILECNLHDKSKLYEDDSLQQLFLMNNIHYMAQKVKGSKLRTVLGDGWIRKHNLKFQQHAMNYERATWSWIPSLLKHEGIQNPSSNPISRAILKERLQRFYLAFEVVYKNQTGWSIPDSQLRDDLRISASLNVIQAYRTFVGRYNVHIGEKHIKYTAGDLEDRILDLFEGSQKSLHSGHKK